MAKKNDNFKGVPVLLNYNMERPIGWMQIKIEDLNLIGENSVFTIGYIPPVKSGKLKKKFDLIEISLTDDASYKKFLDQKYGKSHVILDAISMKKINKKQK